MINSCLSGNEFNQIVSSLKAWLSSTSETESGAEGRDGQGLNEIRMNRKEAGFVLEPLPPGYISRWDDNPGPFPHFVFTGLRLCKRPRCVGQH